MQQVLDRELDGAFVYGPLTHPLLKQVPSYNEELVLISEAGAASQQEQQKPMLILSTGALTDPEWSACWPKLAFNIRKS